MRYTDNRRPIGYPSWDYIQYDDIADAGHPGHPMWYGDN